MSGIISTAVAGIAFCFCTATSSLCSSWCGNDKSSTIPPSATSGRKRSVLLLALSVAIALIFQYAVAPKLQPDQLLGNVPYVGKYLVESWTDGCLNQENPDLVQVCSGNTGVYRASFAAFVFFCIFGIAAKCKPTANREAWLAKYTLYLFLCIGTVFIPNVPLFLPIYQNAARVGSVLFAIFQQVILVDIAYNWNESWISKADQAEVEEGVGKGKKWLAAILVSCAILYISSIVGIIFMYINFGGCSTNNAFISITWILSLLCTVVQLALAESGSLLTSACITAYVTYLCGTAVSKNSNSVCNPTLGEISVGNIALGLLMATMSLLWTGYSYTAEMYTERSEDSREITVNSKSDSPTAGGVVINNDTTYGDPECPPTERTQISPNEHITSNRASINMSWKLNIILAMISCWYAMVLTGWGSIQKRGNIANPDAGDINMWLLISSQWITFLLYFWTLIAPRLFPNRDFS